jgi:hypothetical protein
MCENLADGLKNLTATVGSLRWDIQGQQQQHQGPAVPDTPRNPEPKGKPEVLRRLDKNFESNPKVPPYRVGGVVENSRIYVLSKTAIFPRITNIAIHEFT